MLFWLCIIVFVISIVLYRKFEGFHFVVSSVVSGVAIATMLIVIACNYCGINGQVARCEKQYESLIYKAETKNIRDEFGIVNKDYIDEIADWNMDLASYRTNQRDFWIGIFIPNVFDQFEFIDLENIQYKK